EDFVASLSDQSVPLIVESLAGIVGCGCGLLQNGIGSDHLARHQILADAEMLERTLRLSTPELVRRDFNHTEAICFLSYVGHLWFSLVHLFMHLRWPRAHSRFS